MKRCRGAFVGVGLFSLLINVLMLTGPIFMLQVYDRILTSRSLPSLVALSLLAVTLFLFQGGLEVVRGQILVRLASRVDRKLTPLAFCRCVGKHVAGVAAGIVKGLTRDPALPLVALPPEPIDTPLGRLPVEEESTCRTPQPV